MTLGSPEVQFALGLTLFAGLATGVGSTIAFFARRTNFRFMAISLAFSGGVMLYVSFTEILGKASAALSEAHGPTLGAWYTAGAFFFGFALIAFIDFTIPSYENPHEPRGETDVAALHGPEHAPVHAPLLRTGLFTALAIGIHNFPEGLATFAAALQDPHLGVAIAIAIALHNIPEGVSVSVPIFMATGNRRRAFMLSLLSGLAEPLGALVGFVALQALFKPAAVGLVFAAVAGVMVFISLDELLPTAREHGRAHEVIAGVAAGMAVMSLSLLLLR